MVIASPREAAGHAGQILPLVGFVAARHARRATALVWGSTLAYGLLFATLVVWGLGQL